MPIDGLNSQDSVLLDFSGGAGTEDVTPVAPGTGNRFITSLLAVSVPESTGVAGDKITIQDESGNFSFDIPVECVVAGPVVLIGPLSIQNPKRDGFFWTPGEKIVCVSNAQIDSLIKITIKSIIAVAV